MAGPRNLESIFDQTAAGTENLYPGKNFNFLDAAIPIPIDTGQADAGNAAPNIEINVDLSPAFEISDGGGDLIETIREHLRELADDLAGELAEKISEIFENTPAV